MKHIVISLLLATFASANVMASSVAEIKADMQRVCADGLEHTQLYVAGNNLSVDVTDVYKTLEQMALPAQLREQCAAGADMLLVHCHTSHETIALLPTPDLGGGEELELSRSDSANQNRLFEGDISGMFMTNYLCAIDGFRANAPLRLRHALVAVQFDVYAEYSLTHGLRSIMFQLAEGQALLEKELQRMNQDLRYFAKEFGEYVRRQNLVNTGLAESVKYLSAHYLSVYSEYLHDTCPQQELQSGETAPCMSEVSASGFAHYLNDHEAVVFVGPVIGPVSPE